MNQTTSMSKLAPLANKAAAGKRLNAYVPYSKFPVGAAIVDERGNIHGGCNVETGHYDVMHAETNAIGSMIAAGGRVIEWIAVTSIPCGACLQFMKEFMNEDSRICVVDVDGSQINVFSLHELLPMPFSLPQ